MANTAGINPILLSLTETSFKLCFHNLDSFGSLEFIPKKTWPSNQLGPHLWISWLMSVNSLILIGIKTTKLCNCTRWGKDGLEPCPMLLSYPKILQTMNKRADIENPTDTLSWRVAYLYMTATRKKILSADKYQVWNLSACMQVLKSKQYKNAGFFSVTLIASYSTFSTHAVTHKGYLLLGIIPYFCPLLQLFSQWCSGSCFLCGCQLSVWKILQYKSKIHA